MWAACLKVVLPLFLVFGGGFQAFAWNDTGHMIVTQVAWKHLRPETKQEAERLISLFAPFYPNSANFITAGCWSDDIARAGLEAFGRWHYITLPYDPDKVLTPDDLTVILASSKDNNVKWAIGQCVSTLRDKKSNDFEKALMLRMLLHYVADIHQPLHCTTLYSSHFPEGDRGGNLYQIQGYAKNLHSYWDMAGGLFEQTSRPLNEQDKAYIEKLTQRAIAQRPLKRGGEYLDNRPAVWAMESFQLAVKSAYSVKVGEKPSQEYKQEVEKICLERVALAGYRLAFLLNQLLSVK